MRRGSLLAGMLFVPHVLPLYLHRARVDRSSIFSVQVSLSAMADTKHLIALSSEISGSAKCATQATSELRRSAAALSKSFSVHVVLIMNCSRQSESKRGGKMMVIY